MNDRFRTSASTPRSKEWVTPVKLAEIRSEAETPRVQWPWCEVICCPCSATALPSMRTDGSNRTCQHRIEPDPVKIADRYSARMSPLEWRARLVCSRCAREEVDVSS